MSKPEVIDLRSPSQDSRVDRDRRNKRPRSVLSDAQSKQKAAAVIDISDENDGKASVCVLTALLALCH